MSVLQHRFIRGEHEMSVSVHFKVIRPHTNDLVRGQGMLHNMRGTQLHAEDHAGVSARPTPSPRGARGRGVLDA